LKMKNGPKYRIFFVIFPYFFRITQMDVKTVFFFFSKRDFG
jgi:hypothetical protein